MEKAKHLDLGLDEEPEGKDQMCARVRECESQNTTYLAHSIRRYRDIAIHYNGINIYLTSRAIVHVEIICDDVVEINKL